MNVKKPLYFISHTCRVSKTTTSDIISASVSDIAVISATMIVRNEKNLSTKFNLSSSS